LGAKIMGVINLKFSPFPAKDVILFLTEAMIKKIILKI